MQNLDCKQIKNQVLATLKIEGAKPSKQAININMLFLEKKISSEEAINQILKFHNYEYQYRIIDQNNKEFGFYKTEKEAEYYLAIKIKNSKKYHFRIKKVVVRYDR